jgi:DNA-binding PadR family transcriptional regulator
MTQHALKPGAFHILVALLEGESHGYALLQNAREQEHGKNPLSTASFYRHLRKLVDTGLAEVVARPAGDDPRRGDYYRLTSAGRQVLVEEKERLTALLNSLDGIHPAGRRTRS